jgi:RNA polymerase subunit RPABC4/transcription elongation factor Spt4
MILMVPCRSCGQPIAADAERCPHCGGTTTYKAKGLIVGCVGLSAMIIAAGLGAVIGNVWTAFWFAGAAFLVVMIWGVWWSGRR